MPDKMTYQQINDWLEVYRSSSDEKERERAKAQIVMCMIPVVNKIARTIARRSYDPVEDMVQAGFIGLLKAIENYSKHKSDNFKVYAGYLIIGEMKHYLRDKLSAIRVPRHLQELAIRINNFTKNLTPEEISNLTSEEVASALDTTEEAVSMAMQADRRRTTISLEDISPMQDSLTYEELIADDDYKLKADYEDAKIIFDEIINKLPPEQRVIVDMYYKQDMSKKEIADALLMTQMSITRRMKQAFNIMTNLILNDSEKQALLKGNINTDD